LSFMAIIKNMVIKSLKIEKRFGIFIP